MVTLNDYLEMLNVPATSVVSKEDSSLETICLVCRWPHTENCQTSWKGSVKQMCKAMFVSLGTCTGLEMNTFQEADNRQKLKTT